MTRRRLNSVASGPAIKKFILSITMCLSNNYEIILKTCVLHVLRNGKSENVKKQHWRNHKCLNRVTFLFYTLFKTCSYMRQDDTLKLYSSIFHKIYESLIKNNVSYIKISKKKQSIQRTFCYLKLHLACQHIKICVSIRHTICESFVKIQNLDTHFVKVWWSYVLPNTNAVHYCDIIFRHREMFSTCKTKRLEIQKSGNLG